MKNNNVIQIAIDGPVSSGKSTVGKLVAKALGYCVLDTGILYRAFAWKIINSNLADAFLDHIDELLKSTSIKIEFKNKEAIVFVNGMNVTLNLFTPEISIITSKVAQELKIRSQIVLYAREAAKDNNIIMVGRDVGTVILPDADLKIYLDASPHERALRRFKEYESRSLDISFEKVYNDLVARDNNDTTREHAPLVLAEDAVRIDTTDLNIDDVIEKITILINHTIAIHLS